MNMNPTAKYHRTRDGCRPLVNLAALAAFLITALSGFGQGTQGGGRFTIDQPHPGGINPQPKLKPIQPGAQLMLEWLGFGGPYQVQTKSDLNGGTWSNVGDPTAGKTATITPEGNMGFIRVQGARANYAGADVCSECHDNHPTWSMTRHAQAFETLKGIGMERNASCLACHTVGFGHDGGFRDELTTSWLKGVQCESCHGPAGNHAANPDNLALRPAVTPSAKVCGGCHTDAHHPTYDEWSEAGHGHVTPTVRDYFLSTSSESRMLSCGPCHSGAVRLSMLQGKPLPPKEDAAETSISCATCHTAHGGGEHQLRNPTSSTAFFSYTTSANTTFAAQYNPQVSTCGQCHNQRGATPNDTSRPPHHSPQYNLLIGQVVNSGAIWTAQESAQKPSPHTSLQGQCASCHVHKREVEDPTDANPNYTGHSFHPSTEGCASCHQTQTQAQNLASALQNEVKQKIQAVKAKLDQWGQTKAPETIRATFGALAWEYTSAGQISNPAGTAGVAGPPTADQAALPAAIKEARFCIYMVEHDGSYGIHNPVYARFLLDQADAKVQALLDAP